MKTKKEAAAHTEDLRLVLGVEMLRLKKYIPDSYSRREIISYEALQKEAVRLSLDEERLNLLAFLGSLLPGLRERVTMVKHMSEPADEEKLATYAQELRDKYRRIRRHGLTRKDALEELENFPFYTSWSANDATLRALDTYAEELRTIVTRED